MAGTPRTIKIDPVSRRFYQGVNAGTEIRKAHKDFPFPNTLARVSLFWFYAGAKAAEAGCKTQEEMEAFMHGAATQKPDIAGTDE